MNIRNINLNLLYVFIIVYECKSITLAAEQLNLSQPAVSNALTRLKQTLNHTLFINKNRKIVSTRLADNLYIDIKASLKKIEISLSELNSFAAANSQRTFHMATCNCGDMVLFPKLIPYLKIHAPKVKVNHIPFSDEDLHQQVLKGDLDLLMFFDFPVGNEVIKEHLFQDSMVLVTGPKHISMPDRLSINDVMKLDLVGHGAGFEQYVPLLAQLKQDSNYCCSQLNIDNIWSVLNIVVTSDHAAVVPAFFAKIVAKFMPLKIHKLDDEIASMNLYLYWRELDNEDSGHRWFRSVVSDIVRIEEKNG